MKLKTILVPFDLSSISERACNAAVYLARLTGARLVFLHVVVRVKFHVASFDYVQLDEESVCTSTLAEGRDYEERLRMRIENMLPTGKTPPLQYEIRIIRGRPCEAVLNEAKDKSADLIVMGTHGRLGIIRWLAGSVTERVARLAHCPVLIVK